MDGCGHRRKQRRPGLQRPHYNIEITSCTLVEGNIQDWPVRGVQRAFFDVFHDAHDFYGLGWIGEKRELFAEGIFTLKVLSYERLVNDSDMRLRGILRFIKVTAAQQSRPQ